ncbi:unnamed protein product [Medioppia subpectinata]|uniref:Uncharacterized protein n=1 Tax=Medioppia subpectinata TaxID=1979941 RepID=A0A7R9L657_9ACAR|nr:unnamed protein product [Medioppia subpectinata]CAG2116112.1 unnamed protein product [Medioppia subpectinata]
MICANPLCDQNITIDSAFMDRYCCVTLFADNTVYQLTVNTTDRMNPVFRYKRSQTLSEWSNGDKQDYSLENVVKQ